MEKEKLIETIQEKLSGWFKVVDIAHANYKPHPYMIGPKHITFAADNYGGMLGTGAIEAMEKKKGPSCCTPGGCNLYYDQHTSDHILFLQMLRHMTNEEANTVLKPVGDIMQENKIDGLTLVESPEKYRITP